jgi:polysaccharide biosynthesis/export protein
MRYVLRLIVVLTFGVAVAAQQPPPTPSSPTQQATAAAPKSASSAATTTPPGYLIGPGDVLLIVFWREKDLSAEVVVRPDGHISLPLLNDVQAAGLTPDQLRQTLIEVGGQFLENPTPTVVVKEIRSRLVFITGSVAKPGSYPLNTATTVMQLVSMAGGLLEYADKENIVVMHVERRPDGEPWSNRVNYAEIMKRRNLKQNIELKPGDTVIVP